MKHIHLKVLNLFCNVYKGQGVDIYNIEGATKSQ